MKLVGLGLLLVIAAAGAYFLEFVMAPIAILAGLAGLGLAGFGLFWTVTAAMTKLLFKLAIVAILVVVLLSLIGALSGCGKTEEPTAVAPPTGVSTPPEATGELIVYSAPDLNNTYWLRVSEGVKAAAEQAGYKLQILDAQGKADKQLSDIQNILQKKPKALLISPYESDPIVPAVKQANEAGAPVIIVDIGISGGEYAALIISDNFAGGKLAGEWMAKELGKGAKVAHIQCQLGAENAQKRGKGFEEAAKAAGLQVVAKQPADSDRSKALTVMQNMLQAHKDLKGVFCQNDEMALGALRACETAGRDDVLICGFDGNKEALEAIQAGKVGATVAQQPEEMGKSAVDFVKQLGAIEPGKEVDVPVVLVTKSNLADFLK
jgi:ribose transport system substrate-binding protein